MEWQPKKRKYSPVCVRYRPLQAGYDISEDCLYLDIIKSLGVDAGADLPVAVRIHGGDWVQGSGVDLRYNMSFIVQQSRQQGQPMLAVTLNYRLSAWGLLRGHATADNGPSPDAGSKWGLRDQRLALHWIQENICAFGSQYHLRQGISSMLVVGQVILPKSPFGVSRRTSDCLQWSRRFPVSLGYHEVWQPNRCWSFRPLIQGYRSQLDQSSWLCRCH